MKKIYYLLVTIALITSLSANAQKKKKAKDDTPKDRIEINLDENNYISRPEILSLDTNGVATVFLQATYEKKPGCAGIMSGTKITYDYVVEKYNKNLTKEYDLALGIEARTVLEKTFVEGQKLYFWFHKTLTAEYSLVELNMLTKKRNVIDCVFPQEVTTQDLNLKDGNMIVYSHATYSRKKQAKKICGTLFLLGIPALFGSLDFPNWIYVSKIDLKKKKFEYTMINEFGKKPHTYFMGSNVGMAGGTGNMVIKDYVKNKAHVYTKSVKVESEIKLGENAEIEMPKKQEIYDAQVNNVDLSEKLIFGNYGKTGQNSRFGYPGIRFQGAYFTKMDGKRVKWNNTIDYKTEIPKDQYVKYKHGFVIPLFLAIRTPQISVSIAIILKQWPGYNGTQLLMHDVIETENELIYVGETRTAKFVWEIHTINGSQYVVKVFDGWITNGFLVTSYDKSGKYLWKKAVKMPISFKTYDSERKFLNIYPDGERLAFGFFNGSGVSTYYMDTDHNFTNKATNSKSAKIVTGKKEDTKVYGADCIKWTNDRFL